MAAVVLRNAAGIDELMLVAVAVLVAAVESLGAFSVPRSSGAPSRSACDVFSRALVLPTSIHELDRGSVRFKKRPP
jgi:hypothetical protein